MSFKKEIKLLDGIMLVAGTMIGSGIFIVSADIARTLGSSGYLLLVWALSGLLTIMAALSYSELTGMFPKAGGQYIFLKEAYNPLISFLYGWTVFLVIQTGTIAAVAVAFVLELRSSRRPECAHWISPRRPLLRSFAICETNGRPNCAAQRCRAAFARALLRGANVDGQRHAVVL